MLKQPKRENLKGFHKTQFLLSLQKLFLMKSTVFFILLILQVYNLSGQDKLDSVLSIISERGEVYVRLNTDRYKSGSQASVLPGFDKLQNGQPRLYLMKNDIGFIKEHIQELEILTAPSMLYEYQMADSMEQVFSGTAYAGYQLYLEIMEYFQSKWPELCTIDTIGQTINDKLLLAARLEKTIGFPKSKPVFLYTSSIHGDETAGYSLMLMLINEFLTQNEEQTFNEILENTIIYILPLENPDGTFFSSDETVFGSTRGNAAGIDLSRNYKDPVLGDHPDGNPWQKETLAMMEFLSDIKPRLSANFHGGAEVVNYPFDSFQALHADDSWLRFVSSEYADTAIAKWPGYMDEFPGGITNGYDWYVVHGGKQDYVTYFLGGRELTIELSNTKTAPESLIYELWETNKSSLINYLRQANYGIHGFVSDSITGESLGAELLIPGYDNRNSQVYSDPDRNGYFVRYLKEGNYYLQFRADGYNDYIIENFLVNDYQKHEINIEMVPVEQKFTELLIELYSDPFNPELLLTIENPVNQEMHLEVYDLQGRLVLQKKYTIPEGYSTIPLPENLKNEIFIIRLRFEKEKRVFKVLRIK